MSKRSRRNKRKKSRKTTKRKKSRKITKRKKFKKSRKIRKKKKSTRTRRTKKISNKKLITKDSDGNTLIKVSESWAKQALVNKNKYQKKYNVSIKENEKFWKKEGKRISWIKPYSKIKDVKYSKDEVKIKWYYDGTLNASVNCIDRHLKKNGSKTAIIWVGDDPVDSKRISYKSCTKMSARPQTL